MKGCKVKALLDTYGPWAGRDLYRVTTHVTRGLGAPEGTSQFSRLLRQTELSRTYFYPNSHGTKKSIYIQSCVQLKKALSWIYLYFKAVFVVQLVRELASIVEGRKAVIRTLKQFHRVDLTRDALCGMEGKGLLLKGQKRRALVKMNIPSSAMMTST